jgi:AcrR family transcriptional regulator
LPKIIVTELQWVEAGIQRFAHHGVEGLVIEKMAAELGCSKSSFYWYFTDRQAFIQRIVERWTELSTAGVMQSAAQHAALLEQMFRETGRGDFLFYLRKLAASQRSLEQMLEEVEQLRMNYVAAILVQAGLPQEAAVQRADILYHYYLGWYERHKHTVLTDEQLAQQVVMLRKQLLGGLR